MEDLMKKSICAIIAASLCLFTMPVFAGEAKFTRSTGSSNLHMYNFSDYQVGNYRSNFVSIPQNRMLNYLDGFRGKVGVFELDGNILYVGLDENAAIQLCDSNMNFYVTAKSYKTREESYFKYTDYIGIGVISQIELGEKKYTIAIAALNSNKAGLYTETDGFRMWVENELPKDTAESKTIDKELNYDSSDIIEGIYKPGWKRIWGDVLEDGNYKYNYNNYEFIFNWNNNAAERIVNTDGSIIKPSNISVFRLWYYDESGKKNYGCGIGIEADFRLGNNKVRMAVISFDGYKRVFVKDSTGYPVLPKNVQANGKKAEKVKVSGKSASFTRDYEKGRRLYSDSDISKGIYKSNYKIIPQNGNEEVSFKVNMKEKGEVTLSCKSGFFNIDDYQISIFYNPEMGWQIIPKSDNIKSLSYKTKNRFDLSSEKIRMGMQAEVEVSINDKNYDLTFVCLNAGKGDYRAFIKIGPNEESALSEKDNYGIEYYDMVDIRFGVYKPGFESINKYIDKDESHKAFFENVTEDEPVFIFDYKGNRFLIGPAQDPANYVKNLDGSVIYNPELQIRLKTIHNDETFHCYPWLTYGWEGKVRLGDKDVTLAFVKWGAAVFVFVKE